MMTKKNHATYNNNKYTSLEKKEVKPVEPGLMNKVMSIKKT